MQITKVARRGNAWGITIPRAYLRELKWRLGDRVYLEIVADAVAVRRVPAGAMRSMSKLLEGGAHGQASETRG